MRTFYLARALALTLGLAATQAEGQDVVVSVAPPPAPVEMRSSAPSRDTVWMPGYWRWDGTRYLWMGGRWASPPEPSQTWVAPRWMHHRGAWLFIQGYWSSPESPVIVPEALPSTAPVERVAPTPMDLSVRPISLPLVAPSTTIPEASLGARTVIQTSREAAVGGPVAPPPRAKHHRHHRHHREALRP